MRKIIILSVMMAVGTISVSAQGSRGFQPFQDFESYNTFQNEGSGDDAPINPGGHGTGTDHSLPIGGGGLLLMGFGIAYLFLKKKKEDKVI